MATVSLDCCFAYVVGISHQIAECGDTSITGALRGLSFDFAHGFFQRQSLARDFGFGKWRVYGAQLG